MIIKNIVFLISLLVANHINAQVQNSLIGFQDIPWGSSVQDVKVKFPKVMPKDICKEAKENEQVTREFLTKKSSSCINYLIEKYDVGGDIFGLIFTFNLDGGLKNVVLNKIKEGTPSISTPECQAAYSRLDGLLNAKYGPGMTLSSELDYSGFRKMGFQNHEMRVWMLGPTQINLSNSWNNHKNQNLCWVNLSYIPSKQAAASKL